MSGPDFIFLGASKAGSSWLHSYLTKHPDIFVPTAKDIYFFQNYYDKGKAWYEAFFEPAKPGQVTGEICHDYLHNPDAIARIAADYPNAKLICSLRQPVDRAISTYLYAARHGLVDPDLKAYAHSHRGLFSEGFYADDLKHVYAHFPHEQVLVFLYDDLQDDPKALAQKITDFLSVPYFDYDKIGEKVRAAAKARSMAVNKMGKRIARQLRSVGMHNLLGKLKNSTAVQKLLYKEIATSNTDHYRDLPPDVIAQYLDNIKQLEKMLDRPLDAWTKEIVAHAPLQHP